MADWPASRALVDATLEEITEEFTAIRAEVGDDLTRQLTILAAEIAP
jgi:hypothetical protein